MTQKNKNIILICVAIFIGSYVFRGLIFSLLRLTRPPVARTQPKLKPKAPPGQDQAQPETPPIRNLSGVWFGNGQVKDKGSCHLNLELKRQPDNTTYSAYTMFTCTDYVAQALDKSPEARLKMLTGTKPETAILSGKPESAAVHFSVDQAIEPDINGCTLTDFKVTPFGDRNIAAEWQSGKCPGGNMILSRKQ